MRLFWFAVLSVLVFVSANTVRAEENAAAPVPPDVEAPIVEPASETKEIMFADGKTGEIHQNHVYITRFGGLRMAAPDGKHKLKDGSSIEVKDGMLVADESPAQQAPIKVQAPKPDPAPVADTVAEEHPPLTAPEEPLVEDHIMEEITE